MKIIRDLTVRIPDDVIDKAHGIYKQKGFEYGRTGPFWSRNNPSRVIDKEKWNSILFKLMPNAFHRLNTI